MKVSVLIPAYNAALTIRQTLDSVLGQTITPDEVIVLDDGSTDETFSVVESYKPRVSVLRQPNQGVARSRNVLCERASGDLVAFVDTDDLWHPKYLEVQCKLFRDHGNAVGFFTWHENFHGYGSFEWSDASAEGRYIAEVIDPLAFLQRYNKTTGFFASMSYFCIPKKVLARLGNQPFCEKLSGVEDSFLCTTLPLLGPVVFFPAPLVAYRITGSSLSVHRLERFGMWVEVFTLLEDRYKSQAKPELVSAFRAAYASKRRSYAKLLMGADQATQAREQLWRSVGGCQRPLSMAKSLALWSSTYMPRAIQPKWPSRYRG
jgi:glycosyltransferase involved in cell wall biosynthesis